jgi:PhoPQ-activated pathogenicity-related protein
MTRTLFFLFALVIAQGLFVSQGHGQALTPETALQGYLNNGDKTYRWQVKETYQVGEATAYSLLLTSQQWHEYVWTHQLTILVPAENNYDAALFPIGMEETTNFFRRLAALQRKIKVL